MLVKEPSRKYWRIIQERLNVSQLTQNWSWMITAVCWLSLQCSDTVGWVTGRASGLQNVGCWFVGGDGLAGAMHVLRLQLSTSFTTLSSDGIQNGDILILTWKMAIQTWRYIYIYSCVLTCLFTSDEVGANAVLFCIRLSVCLQ